MSVLRFWFEYTFEDGAVYCDPMELDWIGSDDPEGEWEAPFPNVEGDTFAFGSVESFAQGDIGPMLFGEHGDVVKLRTWRA